eukprot:358463-Amphidinium_carterae.1
MPCGAEVEPGFSLVRINGRAVRALSIPEVREMLRSGETMQLIFKRPSDSRGTIPPAKQQQLGTVPTKDY